MKSSREKTYSVVVLVRSLQTKEASTFLKWIRGSTEKETELLINLFSILKKSASKAEIWAKIYPDTPYQPNDSKQDRHIRRIFFALKKQVEDFLLLQLLDEDKTKRSLLLLKELHGRRLSGEFESLYRKSKKELDKEIPRSYSWYRSNYELESLYQQHLLTSGKNLPKENLSDSIQMYDLSWILESMMIEISRLDFNQRGEKLWIHTAFNEKLDYILSLVYLDPAYWNSPLISLFDSFRNTYKEPETDLMALWINFKEHFRLLERETAVNLFFVILNACIIASKEKHAYEQHSLLVKLYEWGIKTELLLIKGLLPHQHYKNFIVCCLQVQKFEEAKSNLSKLKGLLEADKREMFHDFGLGVVLFTEKKYRESIKILSQAFSDIHLSIQSRLLVAQSWFELQDEYDITRQLQSLNAFIKTQKLQQHEKDGYLNRVRYFLRLLHIDEDDILGLESLHIKIKETKRLFNPEWLLNKTDTKNRA